jgi:hypothetical protein
MAALYGTGLASSRSVEHRFSSSSVWRVMMLVGIFLHGFLWLALLMGGRWNLP